MDDSDRDISARAARYMLARGMCTAAEAATLTGRSRQIARYWQKAWGNDPRSQYLERTFARTKDRLARTPAKDTDT